ncbi:MAG: DegT/DnrJ/EryC1/StrS family aminotransferase [Deltaproteobacteria bacterium]|jgi:dTDP-4-amino-4,6-dideoxygalactose transaminase|nr:DegT/DnrJ/EryC1/StrS family aminotransferase [Deltaproteobacteria bacterium]
MTSQEKVDSLPFIDLRKQFLRLEPALREALLAAAGSAQYILGPQVRRLEEALAEYVGVRECVACANGTDALMLALLAWDVGPGEAVFCPAFTFFSTAEVVALRGATPIFVDVNPVTFNIDPASLEEMIGRVQREGLLVPRAVIPVDLFGLPYDYEAVARIADRHGLVILEDAAQGFGGVYGGRKAGSLGQVGATSFFPAKPLGCYGDGGAVFTNNVELADVIRSSRAHGTGGHRYEHIRLGLNSRLDTLQAAVLLVKLDAFPAELDARQEVALRYERALAGLVPSAPAVPGGLLSAWAQYTVRVPAERRAAIMEHMRGLGVPTMVYYPKCLHLQPVFASLGGRPGQLPQAEKAASEVMSLPMHPYLGPADQDRVVAALLEALEVAGR